MQVASRERRKFGSEWLVPNELTGGWDIETPTQVPAQPAGHSPAGQTDNWGNSEAGCVPAGLYSVWDDQTESWEIEPTTLERATAHAQSLKKPGYRTPVVAGYAGEYAPVFNLAAYARQTARAAAQAAQDAQDSARRAATVASIAAQAAAKPAPAKTSREETLRLMLARNESSLASELAKKKRDRAEVARLQANCAKLRADLGIKTAEDVLLTAVFG